MGHDDRVRQVEGTITLADGSTSQFSITTDGGWQQWGADTARLGRTGAAMGAMVRGLLEDDLLTSDADPEDEDEDEYALALLIGVHVKHGKHVQDFLDGAEVVAHTDGTGWKVWSEPVGTDDNDPVTHLVHVDVESVDQGRALAVAMDAEGWLTPIEHTDVSPGHHRTLVADAVGADAFTVLGFVTNAYTYCEGAHWAIVRGADPVDLLA